MGYLSTVPATERLEGLTPHNDNFISTTCVFLSNGSPEFIFGSVYGSVLAGSSIPRFEMREEEMPPRHAARFVHDELLMDGTPALNLASFVTTYMEEEVEKLMVDNLSKNFIDVEEYPALGEIETRCVNILGRLFNGKLYRFNLGTDSDLRQHLWTTKTPKYWVSVLWGARRP